MLTGLVLNMTSINKKCIITGANGYLGNYLTNYFKSKGWKVIRFIRNPLESSTEDIDYSLEKIPNINSFKSCDLLIHTAYDFNNPLINLTGFKNLLINAKKSKIKKIINISTISAFDGCKSIYGKTKLEMESIAHAYNAINIRCGLIYGSSTKGLFGEIKKNLKNNKLVPIIGNGKYYVYLTNIKKLADEVYFTAKSSEKKVTKVFITSNKIKFVELLKNISVANGFHNYFIKIPWRLIYFAIKLLEIIGVKLKFRSDSIIGLINEPIIGASDIKNSEKINFKDI